ncbi:MAG: DNA polymerase III subunit gamma/tau [Scytonema sp. PMC 1069.18]|nr:DNA polymerase III subunit gamma/tau [Scytonema sp. PMC 1069.18]MEC4881750.1 DNA polymerase III subunit gamma/tau [Scytonema sp. PMC 1070.18]
MYQPLHLKFRPQTLDEVIGQEHIVRTLTNAILPGGSHSGSAKLTEEITHYKIAPAYLFNGPKGTGKTSTARIIAKSLNCQSTQEPTIKPCGECNSCKGITASSSLDVTELDAASNSGVELMRELISTTQFAPVEGRFKIFIIDECHALSSQSWQALLKTIENPPRYVVFIFCTTEIHKVPETIVSRCQKFDFRRIKQETLVQYLSEVAQKENININASGIQAIVKSCGGFLRDCLVLLDQLTNLGVDEITPNWVWELAGVVPEHDLLTLTENLAKGEIKNSLQILHNLIECGKNPFVIYSSLTDFLKNLLVAKIAPTSNYMTQLEEDTWKELVTISQMWETTQVQSSIALLMSRQNLMRDSEAAQLWLEATLIELSNLKKTKQPWSRWRTIQDALNWGQEQLPHLSQSELEEHWNSLTPVQGKKAGAWVELVYKLQLESRLQTA